MNKRFSIIIPTLNEEFFLPVLLKDLTKQKFKNFEVIIVDGMSSDNTKKVVDEYSDSLPITFLTSKKRNVSIQRNIGAVSAQGEYLIFLDADCKIDSDFLSKVNKSVNKYKYLLYLPALATLEKNYEYIIIQNFTNFIVEASQVLKKPFSNGGSIIIQREIFLHIGKFNEKLYISEDHELIQRAKKFGIQAKFIGDAYVHISLRRIQKEGRLKLLSKYVYAAVYSLTKGDIENKIFTYDMGGHGYELRTKNSIAINKKAKIYYEKYKKELQKLLD